VVGQQHAAQVRVAFELDAVHVVDLALDPGRALVDAGGGRNARAAFGQVRLEAYALAAVHAVDGVNHGEAALRIEVRAAHVVHGRDVRDHVELQLRVGLQDLQGGDHVVSVSLD